MPDTVQTTFEVHLPTVPRSKFERERQAFARLLPELLTTHRGKYVAIHEEQVAEVGDDQVETAMRVLQRIGALPIFVGLVCDEPESIYRSGVRRDLGPARTRR